MESTEQFQINFTTREGEETKAPLALLWALIESYQVNIFEVSLSRITDDFIDYMKTNNLTLEEEASFAVMAAKLVYYKSKLLLPDPGFEEETDMDALPIELVDQLLEYRKYQEIALKLRQFEEQANMGVSPSQCYHEYVNLDENIDLDLISFLKVFQEYLLRVEKSKPMVIEEEDFTIEELIDEMRNSLKISASLSFFNYIKSYSLLRSIGFFLSILELLKMKEIIIEQSENFGDILVTIRKHGIT